MRLKVDKNTDFFELITENTTLFFLATLNYILTDKKIIMCFGKYGDYNTELNDCSVIAEKVLIFQEVEDFKEILDLEGAIELEQYKQKGLLCIDILDLDHKYLNDNRSFWSLNLMGTYFEFTFLNVIDYEYKSITPIMFEQYVNNV